MLGGEKICEINKKDSPTKTITNSKASLVQKQDMLQSVQMEVSIHTLKKE
jgi:hypothetical protein